LRFCVFKKEKEDMRRLLCVAAVLFAASFCFAKGDLPMVEHVDGVPEGFHKGEHARFAVWHHKDGGWHIAVTSAGHRHHFKGRIWIEGEGKFGEAKQWKGEGEIKAEEGEANWFHKALKRGEKDRELTFDVVEESKHLAGVFFEVEGAGPLKWELGIGGPADKDKVEHNPEHVFIGHKGQHPESVPFQTFAHPDEKKHGK
jgi:hypothetical protein